jgi:hypothetical protein
VPLMSDSSLTCPQLGHDREQKTLARVDDQARMWKVNTARDIIYNRNFAVDTTAVEKMLKPESLVPTAVSTVSILLNHANADFEKNVFSNKLGPLGFNLFLMFVVDLMHKVELGIWRALFIHLLRILNAVSRSCCDN